uniref:Retrotransposon gag domain-containing protein n=1 Tax=Fagus sylvatica TaxID=28930 RepID=A0A2N9II19_FAGSY
MENGIVGREEIPSKGSRQPDDPSEFDWYAEINLDDIVEDEMDLDNLQDEEADWGYFMEDDTDEWRDDGDPEVHLQKYGEKMALHLENELLMISVFPESLSKQTAAWFYQLRNLTGWDDLVRVFLERYRFNPHSILEYLGLKKDEEPYIIPDPGVGEVIVEIKEEPSVLSLPALTEEEEEEVKPLPPPPNLITTAMLLKKKTLALWLKGLSIHTIAEEEDSTTTPPTRHCQQGEEVKTWTCVPLLQRVSSSNE